MKKYLIAIISLLFIVSAVLYASNYDFLNNSPYSYFTDKDWDLFNAAKQRAINSPEGSRAYWHNATTGAWGYFTITHARIEKGLPCKDMTINDNAAHRSDESIFRVCKLNGIWKLF